MANVNALELYAKVEELLGVKEVAPRLYGNYLLFLNHFEYHSLLDVGCGSGEFLSKMRNCYRATKVKGIDLSPLMVERTQALGIEAEVIGLENEKASYDVITAVFDMLNYLNPNELQAFLKEVKLHLNDGGVFLCDINTLYGFEEVAVGSFIVDDEDSFLAIDSEFSKSEYFSEFTLFEEEKGCYMKSKEEIRQYFHTLESIQEGLDLELIQEDEVFLYTQERADKLFLVFKNL